MKNYSQKQIEFISSQFERGQRAIQTGALNIAEKCYVEILKIDANIHEAQNALAFVYTFTKQHAKAVEQLRKMLQSEPSNANAHHNLANNLYELNNYDEAIMHYQAAIKLNPTFIDSYIQCAMVHRKLKAYDLAIELLDKAYNLDRFNPKALHGLGITYVLLEDHPRAIEFLSKAVALAPNNNEFNLCLARALEAAKLEHEADIQYHNTCSKFPDYLDAFLAYGDLLTKNRYFDQALECYNHAHQLDPKNPDHLDDLGKTYLSMANIEMAINKFEAALKLEPNRVASLIGLEQAYQESGKLDDAVRICHQITAIDKDQPTGFVLESKVKKSTPDDGLAEHLQKF